MLRSVDEGRDEAFARFARWVRSLVAVLVLLLLVRDTSVPPGAPTVEVAALAFAGSLLALNAWSLWRSRRGDNSMRRRTIEVSLELLSGLLVVTFLHYLALFEVTPGYLAVASTHAGVRLGMRRGLALVAPTTAALLVMRIMGIPPWVVPGDVQATDLGVLWPPAVVILVIVAVVGWAIDQLREAESEARAARVAAETTNEQLEAEVAERRRAEDQLAVAIADLADHVEYLRQLNKQISQLTEMSYPLQAAGDSDEAFDVVVRFAPEVFAGAGGAIYVATSPCTGADLVRSWGPRREFSPAIETDGCTVLQQGGSHHGQGDGDSHCSHLPPGRQGRTQCIPLTAQGEVLGLLSLVWEHDHLPMAVDAHDARHQPADRESQRVALAAADQLALALANLALRKELRTQSIRDALTGLYNRRYLDETLDRELQGAARADLSVSLLMIDIDHFKEFNDTYGHAAGDSCLSEVARVLLDSVRSGDIACRFGGEEFAVVMTGTDEVTAAVRAEDLRAGIALRAFRREGQPSHDVTVSIGVATRPQHGTSPDSLLRSADRALYRAKDSGRNQVVTAS